MSHLSNVNLFVFLCFACLLFSSCLLLVYLTSSQIRYYAISVIISSTHSITLVVRLQIPLVVACNSRQTLVFIPMLALRFIPNWPRGSHSLFAPRDIVLVVSRSCIVIL